ncbi:MAG TPA: HDOD domain-containing protein [Actinotalea sp.]
MSLTDRAAHPGQPLDDVRAIVHREPVRTMDGGVIGYTVSVEFVLAGVPTQRGAHAGDHRAIVTPEVVHATCMSLDLPNLVADRYAFLPATPAMLDGFVPQPVVSGRLVLDLPVGYEHTDGALDRAGALRGLGMELCLVDYRGEPYQEALLPHLAYVVVDAGLPGIPLADVVRHVHAAGARVLAAGVGTAAIHDACRAAGVDAVRLLPGQVRPIDPVPPVGGPTARTDARVLRAAELQCLALMHLLSQPEVDLAEVSQVIDTDPVLTLRCLHLVNSGAFALNAPVDTVHRAVVLLGIRELTTLVAALLLDSRPDAMDSLWFILARALTCEALADDPAGYTVGMLSALSAQLGVPADVVLEKVGVSQGVADAVSSQSGPLGAVLSAVRAHEHQDSAGVYAAGLLPAEVSAAYVRCLADALATAKVVTRDDAA